MPVWAHRPPSFSASSLPACETPYLLPWCVKQNLLDQKDKQAKTLIMDYEKIKKKVMRTLQENPADTALLNHPKVRLLFRCKVYQALRKRWWPALLHVVHIHSTGQLRGASPCGCPGIWNHPFAVAALWLPCGCPALQSASNSYASSRMQCVPRTQALALQLPLWRGRAAYYLKLGRGPPDPCCVTAPPLCRRCG